MKSDKYGFATNANVNDLFIAQQKLNVWVDGGASEEEIFAEADRGGFGNLDVARCLDE